MIAIWGEWSEIEERIGQGWKVTAPFECHHHRHAVLYVMEWV